MPNCIVCGKLRERPLFFIMEGGDSWPICHDHVSSLIGKRETVKLGGWEYPLSGGTYIVKVRK